MTMTLMAAAAAAAIYLAWAVIADDGDDPEGEREPAYSRAQAQSPKTLGSNVRK